MNAAGRAFTAIAFSLLVAPGARAAGAGACIDHHEGGQKERKQGHFLSARAHFLACAAEDCPSAIRSDCAALASFMDAAIPSVVLAAVDDRGEDVRGATVRIDGGEPLALDGHAVSLDPGSHRFVFEAKGAAPQDVPVVLREAERFRRVSAVLAGSAGAEKPLRIHPLAFVFGGVGVAATVSFAVFALNGKSTEEDLRSCETCTSEDVDVMRTQYLIADVSLIVALTSFTAGTWFLLHPPKDEPRTTDAARLRLQWSPAMGPGMAGITARGTF